MKALLILLALTAVARAEEPKLPVGLTCEKVHEHYTRWYWVGKANIVHYMITVLKYSAADVRAVERCLSKE